MKNLYCRLFKHKFVVKKNVTASVKEYRCIHCNKQVTTSDRGHLTPLTKKRQEINKDLERLYKTRTKRRQETCYS
ncbi:hypothetical protein [Mangrovimonas cancribranchiae]|uniref:Uncharacterized protein n=1 Tax=Mangrovimonas cancribranchiae TaxID=3080055 RepID=A0AAU6P8N0_9FLAO